MFSSVFTRVRAGTYYRVGVVSLFVMVVGVVLVWVVTLNAPALSRVEEQSLTTTDRATDTQAVVGIRDVDAYSVQLDRLRWRANRVQHTNDANAFALQLDDLARDGRQAFVDARIATPATVYAYHLDALRRMGRHARASSAVAMDANAYGRHLDELRRLGHSDYAVNAVPADANAYAYWLDHLRRMGPEHAP